MEEIHHRVKEAAAKRLLFLPHAIHQMSRLERMISSEEIETVIWSGEVIEDYAEDKRGHSCLMLGYGQAKRALHIVCAPKQDYLAIITAYCPDSKEWSSDYKRRKA